MSWNTLANTGPAIDDYDAQYREGASGAWTMESCPQDYALICDRLVQEARNWLQETQSYALQFTIVDIFVEPPQPWLPSLFFFTPRTR